MKPIEIMRQGWLVTCVTGAFELMLVLHAVVTLAAPRPKPAPVTE